MKQIEEILTAVRRLSHHEFVALRQAIDAMDDVEWQAELARSTADWEAKGLTDEDIDRAVERRRYESRS